MKRSPIKIAFVVLAYLAPGAVVTIAVSWGVVIWIPAPGSTDYARSDRIPHSLHMVPADWPALIYSLHVDTWTRSCTQGSFDVPEAGWGNAKYFVNHLQSGWPCRALEAWHLVEMPGLRAGQTPWQNGIPIPAWMPRFMPYNTAYAGNVPIHPVAPGFAANSAFYGAGLWFMALAASRARAARRARRGLCPACAYPAGISETCTECGRELPRWVVRVREDNTQTAAMRKVRQPDEGS